MNKKRNIVIAALLAMLTFAMILSAVFSDKSKEYELVEDANMGKILGDSQLVDQKGGDSEVSTTNDYFSEAKISREKTRSEAVSLIQTIVDNGNSSKEAVDAAQTNLSNIAQAVQNEAIIENLIMAKGFEGCMAYINNDSINIIVKTSGLSKVEAAQITDIVVSQTDIPAGNIKIVEMQ